MGGRYASKYHVMPCSLVAPALRVSAPPPDRHCSNSLSDGQNTTSPPHHLATTRQSFDMAQDLQKLKDDIWYAKGDLEKQQRTYDEWVTQVSAETRFLIV